MLVALERFDLRIRESHSLKQKRHVVKALTNGIRSTFNVVGAQEYHLRKVLHEIEQYVERWAEVELLEAEVSVHYEEE